MRRSSKIILGIGIIVVLIQLDRPSRNESIVPSTHDLSTYDPALPPDVKHMLSIACYDCHSDHSRYPWYFQIQPVGWWMAHHIKDGKSKLNFSRWGTYPPVTMARKLKHISRMVTHQEMPISSYLWEHQDARLTVAQRTRVAAWADSLGTTLPAVPPDSTKGSRMN